MRFTKFLAALTTVGVAALLTLPALAGDKAVSPGKLEPGVWIAKVVEAPGQWTYVVVPDTSGRRGAAHGTIDVGIYVPGLDEMTDRTTPLLVDLVVTKPGVIAFNSVWYGVKKITGGMTTAEIIYIGTNRGEIRMTGPGKAEGTHHIEFYLAAQDADHDGLPDANQPPVAAVDMHTTETRVGQYVAP